MCKVTVKGVEKFLKGASGEKDGKPWELHVFKCLVSVDGAEQTAVRTCKTFDSEIAGKIKTIEQMGGEVTFEAKKEGDQPPFDFLLVPERKSSGFRNRGGKGGTEPFGPTNRQQALKIAVARLNAAAMGGDVPTAEMIIAEAEVYLNWLEGGAK